MATTNAQAVTYVEVVDTAVAHWQLQDDENTNEIQDEQNQPGEIVGGNSSAITTTGPIETLPKAFALRGYSHLGRSHNVPSETITAGTYCAWVRPVGSQTNFSQISGRAGQFVLHMKGLTLGYAWSSHPSQYDYVGPSIADSTWSHVAVRVIYDRAEFFINGVLAGTNLTNHPSHQQNGTVYIGRHPSQVPFWINGDLADIQLYHRALSDDEIAAVAAGPGAPSVSVGDATIRELTPLERAAYGEAHEFLAPGYKQFTSQGGTFNTSSQKFNNSYAGTINHATLGVDIEQGGETRSLLIEIEADAYGEVELANPNTFYKNEEWSVFLDNLDFPRPSPTEDEDETAFYERLRCIEDSWGGELFYVVDSGHPDHSYPMPQSESFYRGMVEGCGCTVVEDVYHWGYDGGTDVTYLRPNCNGNDCDEDGIPDRLDHDNSSCDDPTDPTDPDDPEPNPWVEPDDNTSGDDSVHQSECPYQENIGIPYYIAQDVEERGCYDMDRDGICDQCDADARGFYRSGCGSSNGNDCHLKGYNASYLDYRLCDACEDENGNGVCDECEDETSSSLSEVMERLKIVARFIYPVPKCQELKLNERLSFPQVGVYYLNWEFDTCFSDHEVITYWRITIRSVLAWALNLYGFFFSFRFLLRV